jgi:LPXTG-motif cell wall-anchored protein
MDSTQIVIAVIIITVLGGILAVWFRRRQQP